MIPRAEHLAGELTEMARRIEAGEAVEQKEDRASA